MKKEIILTPKELYFMGALLQADYMDYAYVAAMGDIRQRREIYESESREGLVKKGVLTEDFSGGLEVDEGSQKILEPVFFGRLESSVETILSGGEERKTLPGRRFHFYEGQVTTTRMGEEGIRLEAVDPGWIRAWLRRLAPQGEEGGQKEVPFEAIDREKVSRVIAVKSTRIGERAAVEIYVEAGGRMFCEKTGGRAQALTREQFCLEAYRWIKGE